MQLALQVPERHCCPHHAGCTFSARPSASVRFVRLAIAPSSAASGARPACVLAPRCLPCHTSELSAHHCTLSFLHAQSAASYYECASSSESWITGVPFGRAAVERMVKLGEGPRMEIADVGGNLAACFLTS